MSSGSSARATAGSATASASCVTAGPASTAGRQALADELGYSETVFVDDPERGIVDIRTPGARMPFAGHPLVGVAWLLDIEELQPPVGSVWARDDGEFTWITALPEWVEGKRTQQYASPAEVEALPAPPPGEGWLYAWAWEDEAAGRIRADVYKRQIRARGFPRRPGGVIAEDEATGSAAILLTAELNRALNITQGAGSQILTAPGPDGTVEIGGRVRFDTPPQAGPALGGPAQALRR